MSGREGVPRQDSASSHSTRRANFLIFSLAPIFLGIGFLQVVIAAWLPTIGFTPLQVSILIAVQGIMAVVFSIPLGIVSDVYGRRSILVSAAFAGSVGLLIYGLSTDYVALLVASAILGFSEGGAVSAWNALLADLTEIQNRNKVFSSSFAMIAVTSGVGLLLPGIFPFVQGPLGISSYAIHRSVLLFLGILSFASPVGVVLALRRHNETHNPEKKFKGYKNMGTLAKLGVVGGSIGLGAGFIIPIVGTWFLLRFSVGDSFTGPVLAVSSILIGLAAFASPRLARRYGQMNAIMLTTGLSMVFMLSMAFLPDVNLAAAFYIIRSGLMNMSGPLMDSFSMSIFPAEQRGLVSAVTNTTFRLPNSVSTSFGGYLLQIGLLEYPFLIASALYVVGLVAFFIFFVASPKYKGKMSPGPTMDGA